MCVLVCDMCLCVMRVYGVCDACVCVWWVVLCMSVGRISVYVCVCMHAYSLSPQRQGQGELVSAGLTK